MQFSERARKWPHSYSVSKTPLSAETRQQTARSVQEASRKRRLDLVLCSIRQQIVEARIVHPKSEPKDWRTECKRAFLRVPWEAPGTMNKYKRGSYLMPPSLCAKNLIPFYS